MTTNGNSNIGTVRPVKIEEKPRMNTPVTMATTAVDVPELYGV